MWAAIDLSDAELGPNESGLARPESRARRFAGPFVEQADVVEASISG